MTQVFFYHNAPDRIGSAAALIGKAFLQRKALLVFAPDDDLASALDRHLWIHPATGFVPHVRNHSPLAPETPVLITDSLDAPPQNERLVNLADDVPPEFSRFTSVIEVVGRGEDERLTGRARAKFYKDRGYEVRFIDLGEKD